MPLLPYSPGLYLAGDDICHIMEKYLDIKSNLFNKRESGFHNFEGSCPLIGCGRSEQTDTFFGEYIRIYWNFPHGD